jgi:hypothetical protein
MPDTALSTTVLSHTSRKTLPFQISKTTVFFVSFLAKKKTPDSPHEKTTSTKHYTQRLVGLMLCSRLNLKNPNSDGVDPELLWAMEKAR